MSNKIYSMVNDKILETMSKGNFTWSKPWDSIATDGWNHNHASKHNYSFLNHFMLEDDRQKKGFSSTGWMSANQMKKAGIRWSGQAGSFVVFFTFLEKKDDNDNVIGKIPFLKYTNVWNLDQTNIELEGDGVIINNDGEEEDIVENPDAEEVIGLYLKREGITLSHGGNKASYSPSLDRIQMPEKRDFSTMNYYYGTLFHEAVHSTGKKGRLNRIDATAFGSESYSKEELVAEVGSGYLMSHFKLEQDWENSAGYIQHWMKAIKDNQTWLVSAFGKAEKAVELILR